MPRLNKIILAHFGLALDFDDLRDAAQETMKIRTRIPISGLRWDQALGYYQPRREVAIFYNPQTGRINSDPTGNTELYEDLQTAGYRHIKTFRCRVTQYDIVCAIHKEMEREKELNRLRKRPPQHFAENAVLQ